MSRFNYYEGALLPADMNPALDSPNTQDLTIPPRQQEGNNNPAGKAVATGRVRQRVSPVLVILLVAGGLMFAGHLQKRAAA